MSQRVWNAFLECLGSGGRNMDMRSWCVSNNTQQLLMSLVVDASHFFVLLSFYCSLCWVLGKSLTYKPSSSRCVLPHCMETARTLQARTYLHSNLSLNSQDNFNREIVISFGQALTNHKLLFLLLIFFSLSFPRLPREKKKNWSSPSGNRWTRYPYHHGEQYEAQFFFLSLGIDEGNSILY